MRKGIAITKSVFKRSLYACIIALMLTGVAPSIPGYNAVLTAEAAAKPALSKTKVSVVKGKTYKLTIKNIKKGTKVKWSTSKKSTATVKASKDGLSCVVTGRKAGTATITAKVSKKSYKCKVTVKNPPVALSAKSKKLEVGKKFNLSLLNTKSSVKWTTSNKKVASIKKVSKYKYAVTGVKKGTAVITAKVGSKKYSCKVTVVPKVAAPKPTIPHETKPSAPVKPTTPVKPSTPETESPSKPTKPMTPPQTEKPVETEKPVTPPQTEGPKETEKPVETEKPIAPPQTEETETEASYIEVVSGDKHELEIGETINITIRSNRNDVSYMLANGQDNFVSVNRSGNVLSVKGLKEGTECIAFYIDDTDAFASVSVKVVPKRCHNSILNLIDGCDKISVAGGDLAFIVLSTSLPSNKISYSIDGVSGGLIYAGEVENKLSYNFWGRIAGTYRVTFTGGGESVTSVVTVTSTDTEWLAYREWMDNEVLPKCGYGTLSPIEVFKNLGVWLVDNRSYDLSTPNYWSLYKPGSGTICDGYADVFVDVATRKLGLKAYRSPRSESGHVWAIVEVNGEKWNFDAGTGGTAGHRGFSAFSRSGEGILYGSIAKPDGSDFRRTCYVYKSLTSYDYYERNSSGQWVKLKSVS